MVLVCSAIVGKTWALSKRLTNTQLFSEPNPQSFQASFQWPKRRARVGSEKRRREDKGVGGQVNEERGLSCQGYGINSWLVCLCQGQSITGLGYQSWISVILTPPAFPLRGAGGLILNTIILIRVIWGIQKFTCLCPTSDSVKNL